MGRGPGWMCGWVTVCEKPALRFGGWRGHQVYEFFLKFREIEVELYVHLLGVGLGSQLVCPGESVAVLWTVRDVDV